MIIVAFDTSGFAGSVALLDGPQLLGEISLDRQRRSAQTLAPAIASLLERHQVAAAQIGLVATTIGPGSFTGLRVGVTTAKALAYAAQAKVIGLSTLEVLAYQTPLDLLGPPSREIQAVLDAQRKELFVGRFRLADQPADDSELPDLLRLVPDGIMAAESWLHALPADVLVTGAGANKLLDRLPVGVLVAPEPLREPAAATVGKLAWREHQRGRRDDLWKLAPLYLRPSYAEEKRTKTRAENVID